MPWVVRKNHPAGGRADRRAFWNGPEECSEEIRSSLTPEGSKADLKGARCGGRPRLREPLRCVSGTSHAVGGAEVTHQLRWRASPCFARVMSLSPPGTDPVHLVRAATAPVPPGEPSLLPFFHPFSARPFTELLQLACAGALAAPRLRRTPPRRRRGPRRPTEWAGERRTAGGGATPI
jgi:hypothetical protein